MALVVLGVIQHRFEQGRLYLMQYHVIQVATGLAIESLQEVFDRLAGAVLERRRISLGSLASLRSFVDDPPASAPPASPEGNLSRS